MKVYVVHRHGSAPSYVFLEKENAEKYVDKVNNSPYLVDQYRITEMEPSDNLLLDAKYVVVASMGYEVQHGGKFSGRSFSFITHDLNSLQHNLIVDTDRCDYREEHWHNSTKVRKQRLGAYIIIHEGTSKEIDKESLELK